MPLAFDNIATTTLQLIRKRLADNIFKANPTFAWFLANGRVRTEGGGKHIEEPLIYNKNNTVQSYKGYDRLNIAPTEELTSALYNWRQAAASISISGLEELMNSGESAVFNLLQQKIKIAEMSMKEYFNEKIHADTATKDLSRDFLGLDEIIEDNATQGTLGGIDRNVYTWWKNQQDLAVTLATASSTNRILTKRMIPFYNTVTKGLAVPDLIITSQSLYEHFEIENHDMLRHSTSDLSMLNIGFTNQKFKNVTMMWDEHTTGGTGATGSMYWINSAHMGVVIHKDRNFVMSDFRRPLDQDARVAQILLAGNMTCNNSRFQGVQTYTNIP